MKPERTFAITLRYFYLMRGSLSRVLPLFVWVSLDMVLWGFISRYLNQVTSGPDFVPQLLGAVLLWDFFGRVLMGVTMVFLEDVWSRNFLNIFATPLSLSEYLGGLIISSIATSMVSLVVMLVLASICFGLSFLSLGPVLAVLLFSLFLFGIALGIVGCSIVLRFGPASEWFVWPIPAIIAPFVGVFYPLSVLPHWMQAVALILPPSYTFEGLRSVLAGHAASGAGLGMGLALSALCVLLSCLLFARVYRHALKTGLIARYSAETLN